MADETPWRATVNFCFYGTLADAERIDKEIDAAIRRATGIEPEGGHFGRMDPRDVVDGSSLHQLIQRHPASTRTHADSRGSG